MVVDTGDMVDTAVVDMEAPEVDIEEATLV